MTPEARDRKRARDAARMRAQYAEHGGMTPEQRAARKERDRRRSAWLTVHRRYLLLLRQRGVTS